MRARPLWLLLGLTVAVFAPTLVAGFVWDDEVLLSHNTQLRGDGAWRAALTADFWASSTPTDVVPGYWRPLVKLSHVALWRVGGGAAWPFHLFNLLLHLASVALAFRWLRARSSEGDGLAALLGAAVFALHPSRFEVVPWASCSTDLLMSAFALGALWALDARRWLLGAALMALAAFSKESAVVVPLLLTADAVLRGPRAWRAVAAAAVGVAVPWALRLALGLAAPPMQLAAWSELPARALTALGFYTWRTVLPWPLTVVPYEPLIDGFGPALLAVGAVVAAGVLALGVRAARVEAWRAPVSDVAWWLLVLSPFLQVLRLPAVLFGSDRFLYFPMLGVAAVVSRLARGRVARGALAGWVLAGAASLALAVPAWESSFTFFAREYALHPDSGFVSAAFAGRLQREGKPYARQALLRTLASSHAEPRYRTWAVGQLAAVTLELTRDDADPVLEELRGFYGAVAAGAPRALTLDGVTYEVEPALALRQVRVGQWDDVALFRATLALRCGEMGDAAELSEALMAAPTRRREGVRARVLLALSENAQARALAEKWTPSEEREAVLAAAANPGDAPAWRALGLQTREDAVLRGRVRDGDAPPLSPERRRALAWAWVLRGREADAKGLAPELAPEFDAWSAARQAAIDEELALLQR